MNELEQLRARLVELSDIYEGAKRSYNHVDAWNVEFWLEVDNIVDTLNLLDPCWVDEVKLNNYFTNLYIHGTGPHAIQL